MSTIPFADRMSHVGFSESLALIGKVRALRRRGVDVVDFGQQDSTPTVACTAAAEALTAPWASFYTDPRGLPELRRTLAAKLAAVNGIAADPETDIVVTVGAKQALFAALLALVDRGDEVLLEDPGYISFEPLVRLAGATPVPIRLDPTAGFRFSLDDVRRRVTSRSRVLVLCNPHNPTGRVLREAELAAVGAFACEFNLRIIVDEAYEHFVFDGRRHVSLASLPGMAERTLTVQTVSKIYNMAGWRVGWLAGPADIVDKVLAVHTHTVTCPASFAQAGVEAVIRAGVGEGNRPLGEIVARYARQRDAMVDGLEAAGVSCFRSEGAYFTFPDLKSFGRTSLELSELLLDHAHVAATPGSAFGAGGDGHVRLVFKAGVDEIHRGTARIATALADLDRPR